MRRSLGGDMMLSGAYTRRYSRWGPARAFGVGGYIFVGGGGRPCASGNPTLIKQFVRDALSKAASLASWSSHSVAAHMQVLSKRPFDFFLGQNGVLQFSNVHQPIKKQSHSAYGYVRSGDLVSGSRPLGSDEGARAPRERAASVFSALTTFAWKMVDLYGR